MDKIFYLCDKNFFVVSQNIHPSRQNILFVIITSSITFVVSAHTWNLKTFPIIFQYKF